MTAERWARIKEVFANAAERVGEARAAYLAEACGPDEELRREVESLLQQGSGSELRSPVHEADWVGREVAHFRILEKLGGGGMGVVYKARDLKLDRFVALKFLPREISTEEEYKRRFIHEAKAASALDHNNICTIYEIDQTDDGQLFIAMAYYGGETLKKKIQRGPLALKEALNFAMQVAQGLAKAHEQDIVHRDIKPANVMVTTDGVVKIVDFGLARLGEATKVTKPGSTLGTPAYMSPEQAQGQPTDRRTDIWSLGVVIYEMLTGKLPFRGEREQAVVYAITNEEPEPMTALRTGVPMELEWMVGKALAKDAADRYQQVEEMIVDLRGLGKKLTSGTSTRLGARPAAAPRQVPSEIVVPTRKLRLQQALFAVTAIALLVLAFVHFRETPVEAPLRRFAFTPESLYYEATGSQAAISPNGRHIAYVAGEEGRKLWVRDLDREQSRELDGTEGAQGLFWSPESEFIGFATSGELRKISVQGGPPITLCPLPTDYFVGGGWSPDGELIAFSSNRPPRIYKVPAAGGEPKLLFEPERSEKGSGYYSLHFLPSQPGSRSIVFSIGEAAHTDIAVKNLETGEWKLLAEGAYPVYSTSGHLIYQTNRFQSGLWALPFSIETLKPTGEAFPIAANVGEPSVAADGTLVFVDLFGVGQWQLVWKDRGGNPLGVMGQVQEAIFQPVLSPNGRSVAVRALVSGNTDVWVHEVDGATRKTFHPAVDSRPQWSPSGREIAFQSFRRGNFDIFSRPTDGTGEPQLLVGTKLGERPYDWSADGKYLLYTVEDPGSGTDLWYLKRKEDGNGFEPLPFLQTPFDETAPNLSPDGRFVAYCSDESGQNEVHVQPFPEGGGKKQVSRNGGCQPRWSGSSEELFYVEGDTLMAVKVTTTPSFSFGSRTLLFPDPNLVTRNPHEIRYDVSPDGKRFILVGTVETEDDKPPSIRVVQNWYEEFRDRERQD